MHRRLCVTITSLLLAPEPKCKSLVTATLVISAYNKHVALFQVVLPQPIIGLVSFMLFVDAETLNVSDKTRIS